MAARRAAQLTSALLTRSSSPTSPSAVSAASKLRGLGCAKTPAAPRSAFPRLKPSRLPVELGGVQSLMPLHSVTASALLNSLLASTATWSSLSEGLATPL
uniref:Uncharacterized protein n=1 Tax=Kalanchoe fedtschenkoi TaxID=63787 RepID=A0A7N0TE04_KALFE